MSARKLGRGLDSLIQKTDSDPSVDSAEVRQLDPRQIRVNRAQPRTHFDDQALRELAASIKNEGMLQPLVVRPDEAGGFELVAGERRLRASLSVGLETVPAVVQAIDPERLLRLALIENIQRENLNPIELAHGYRALQKAHNWTQEQVAERLGKKRSSIANILRFLELEQPIRDALGSGRISAGHAKLLLSLEEGAERLGVFQRATDEAWTVRKLDEEIRRLRGELPEEGDDEGATKPAKGGGASSSSTAPPKSAHILEQEQEFARALGTKVEIRSNGERGRVVIEFYSGEDYERIRRILLSRK